MPESKLIISLIDNAEIAIQIDLADDTNPDTFISLLDNLTNGSLSLSIAAALRGSQLAKPHQKKILSDIRQAWLNKIQGSPPDAKKPAIRPLFTFKRHTPP
jgi:hypothetical protein